MKKTITLLLIVTSFFCQAQNKLAVLSSLSSISFGKNHSKSSVYNRSEILEGTLEYNGEISKGFIQLKRDSLYINSLKINIRDRGLQKIQAYNSSNLLVNIERITDDKLLRRIVLDTMNTKIFDFKILNPEAKLEKTNFIASHDKKFVTYSNSIFRSRNSNISIFIKRLKLNREQESFLKKWLYDNL